MFWLTSEIRTAPWYAPHDASNFLEHARSLVAGHWFGGYNDLTLIKQPFFPIYMAVVEQSGLPLTIANILLNALAAVGACIAISPLFRWRPTIGLLFLALFFNPYSFDSWAWLSDRSNVNPALGLLTVACAAGVYFRRRYPVRTSIRWLVALGASLSAFWLNREDAVWLVPCVIIILAGYAVWVFRHRRSEFIPRSASLLIPAVMCSAAVVAIMFVNGRVYGWKVTNEQQAPEFVSAYNSLVRIDVPKQRYFPLPRAAREIAYSISPAARELRSGFEGFIGKAWASNTCSGMVELCGAHEIGGGWASWALRDSVANAGHYDNAADARAFYIELAKEIDAACDSGRIKCLPKSRSVFPPPIPPAALPEIWQSLYRGTGLLLTLNSLQFGAPGAPPPPAALRLDYDLIARSVYDPGSRQRFRGWVLYDHVKPAVIEGPGSADSEILFSPTSPDIAKAFAKDSRFSATAKNSARFEILSNCDDDCFLVVTGARNSTVRIPLTEKTVNFEAPGVAFHIEASRKVSEFDHALKARIMSNIGSLYTTLFRPLVLLSLLLLCARCVRAIIRRRTFVPAYTIVAFAIAVSCAIYIILLAVMDALAFHTFAAVYLNAPIMQLLFASALTIAIEGTVVFRLARRFRYSKLHAH